MSNTEFTPANCTKLARRLESALGKLESLGVRIPLQGRLARAVGRLEGLRGKKEFPSDREELRVLSYAIIDAVEVSQIAECLAESAGGTIIPELQKLMGGSEGRVGEGASAYQYQSQYLVGAMFAYAGIRPLVPSSRVDGRRLPDFLLPNGNSYVGVEVKRPSSRSAAKRLVRSAAGQIRYTKDTGCGVVVDLTDSLLEEPVLFGTSGSEVPLLQRAFLEIAGDLEQSVMSDRRFAQGFPDRGMFLGARARFPVWDLEDLTSLRIQQQVKGAVFYRVKGCLPHLRSEWAMKSLYAGMREAGLDVVEYKEWLDQH